MNFKHNYTWNIIWTFNFWLWFQNVKFWQEKKPFDLYLLRNLNMCKAQYHWLEHYQTTAEYVSFGIHYQSLSIIIHRNYKTIMIIVVSFWPIGGNSFEIIIMMIRDVVDEINDENEFFFPKLIDFSQLQIQGVFDFLLSLSLSVQLCSSSIFIAQNIIYTRHTHRHREREFDQRLPGWHIYFW